MKRRQFLLGTTSLLATMPVWLREAFAAKACDPDVATRRRLALWAGYARAQQRGKPLLVLVIPKRPIDRGDRGRAFGELLNHGTDAQLAPLALCEVVCAKLDELRRLLPAQRWRGEPLMVLVETDRVPARAIALQRKLPRWDGLRGVPWGQRRTRQDAVIDKRIRTLARLIRSAVLGRPGTLARRAARVRSKLTKGHVGRLERAPVDKLPGELVRRGAPLLALRAARRRAGQVETDHALAETVRSAIVKRPPPGARWARSYGCGVTVEGVKQVVSVACGMGHVPKKSGRMLYFFNKPGD